MLHLDKVLALSSWIMYSVGAQSIDSCTASIVALRFTPVAIMKMLEFAAFQVLLRYIDVNRLR